MSASLIEQVIRLENHDDLHSIRLLILINALAGKKNETKIAISTLSKFDFILRYPIVLERSLIQLNVIKNFEISEAERNSIETEMLAFSYSPWSSEFRKLLVLLSARALIIWKVNGKQIELSLTDLGKELCDQVVLIDEFVDILKQSKVIKSSFANLSIAKLDSLLTFVIRYTNMKN
ncbi:hypothetical protein BK120_08815 [Paenibacillus sp. FSL A5-0031]|uniref:hypothetical protein n=1 Tax=Paenibacillus sp. FSL A5-0031 TaxID=1920420 RepID=UPI00096CA562|nr:hypothetical protein [Paenibacillus sp. FSL A5-0031]OME86082.1 hypothetical protein BK120_08815 [Paenibacillus sp. FSL A5-0031]